MMCVTEVDNFPERKYFSLCVKKLAIWNFIKSYWAIVKAQIECLQNSLTHPLKADDGSVLCFMSRSRGWIEKQNHY